MGNLSILKISNTDNGFYSLMGRVLSRREIVKENGGNPIWDDDGKLWWVAVHNGKVIGFTTATEKTNKIEFNNDYIHPDYRNTTVFTQLFTARLSHYTGTGKRLSATISDNYLAIYANYGFTATGKRGSYTVVERKA